MSAYTIGEIDTQELQLESEECITIEYAAGDHTISVVNISDLEV